MVGRAVLIATAACALAGPASSQQAVMLKAAIVALAEEPALRADFERTLVAKARTHDYDAVTSYDLVPDVGDVRSKNFVNTMTGHGVQAVLMLRPAAIGAGSSLDSVRKEVGPKALADMRDFAKKTSASGADDLIAVVHMAIYVLRGGESELISSGAVWLDEPVQNQAQGIARLQDLMIANVDAAR